jgi:signal peptidase I
VTGLRLLPSRRVRRPLDAAVLLGALAGWFFLLGPQLVGGPAAYLVVSGISMQPTLHAGDLVIARHARRYRVGDVIAYRVPEHELGAGTLIIHRIVRGSARTGFVTKGDNRARADPWRPTPPRIVGKTWVEVPRLGLVLALIRVRSLIAAIAALAGFLYLVDAPTTGEGAGKSTSASR